MTRSIIGLIGAGAIGSTLSKAIDDGTVPNSTISVIYDIETDRAEQLARGMKSSPSVARSFEEFLNHPGVNLVLEASAQKAVELYIPKAVAAGKNVMIMSVGALVNENLRNEIFSRASKIGVKVYLPSGAISGLDCIKAASLAGLSEVTLVTRKPPRGLIGAPGVAGMDLQSLKEPKTVFAGKASDAVRLFPSNVNVAAIVSLSSLGFESTEVKIIADPTIDRNIHEIIAVGKFGRMTTKVENEPMPTNPKTSYLAGLSAVRKLIEINETVQLGT